MRRPVDDAGRLGKAPADDDDKDDADASTMPAADVRFERGCCCCVRCGGGGDMDWTTAEDGRWRVALNDDDDTAAAAAQVCVGTGAW